MPLNAQSVTLANGVMNLLRPDLSNRFVTLIEFLVYSPVSASKIGKLDPGSQADLEARAQKFISGRNLRAPAPPETVPDEMVSFIINQYFDVPESELSRAVELHNLCMGAENLVGDILERYIASVVEPDWVWCSGSIIRAIDFVHKDKAGNWSTLQVKNRDNSENSSSSAIRAGTPIAKWYRTFSKKAGDNWIKFPKTVSTADLSEDNFRNFVADYLDQIKQAKIS